jgi:hypothetical protein
MTEVKLKIRRQPVLFPIAVAGRVEAVAAVGFLRAAGVLTVALGAAGGRFGKRAFGRWRQRPFLRGLTGLGFACGLRRWSIGWHRL